VSGPPLPAGPGPIDTVVSPPESRTAGPPKGRPQDRDDSAIPPMTLPTSRASPSSASPRMSGFSPRLVGASAAAASARAGAATTRTSAGGSRAFGVSSPYSSTRRAAGGCLSGADHDTSAFRRGRQMRRDDQRGVGTADSSVKDPAQCLPCFLIVPDHSRPRVPRR
jgi:hypothetical protein